MADPLLRAFAGQPLLAARRADARKRVLIGAPVAFAGASAAPRIAIAARREGRERPR